jgi:hypothetical protein
VIVQGRCEGRKGQGLRYEEGREEVSFSSSRGRRGRGWSLKYRNIQTVLRAKRKRSVRTKIDLFTRLMGPTSQRSDLASPEVSGTVLP